MTVKIRTRILVDLVFEMITFDLRGYAKIEEEVKSLCD